MESNPYSRSNISFHLPSTSLPPPFSLPSTFSPIQYRRSTPIKWLSILIYAIIVLKCNTLPCSGSVNQRLSTSVYRFIYYRFMTVAGSFSTGLCQLPVSLLPVYASYRFIYYQFICYRFTYYRFMTVTDLLPVYFL